MSQETITLYFRNATSDKVYQATIKEQGNGYMVEFAFGRRGTTLRPGTKTQTPVSYDEAKKIYDKLVAEKMSKGYSPGIDGTPYIGTDKVDRVSGVQCQLLNPIEEDEITQYIKNPDWCFQEKFDGKRMLVRGDFEGNIEAINRKGLIIGLPETIQHSLSQLDAVFIIDGEAVGDKLYVFDILHYQAVNYNAGNIRNWEYSARLEVMSIIKQKLLGSAVELVRTVTIEKDKETFLAQIKSEGKEGIVIKRLDAPYSAGRPSSGGNQLKYKFTETISTIVLAVNAKRSVSIGLINDSGKVVNSGNVTILPNFPIPAVDDIIEVRYLYAHPQSGKLYQPIYLGKRDDIGREACRTSKLKYKAGVDDDES